MHEPHPDDRCEFCEEPLAEGDYTSIPAHVDCALSNTKPKPVKDDAKSIKVRDMRQKGLWKR